MTFQPYHDLPGISPLDEDNYIASTFDATYDPTWNLDGATPRTLIEYNASADQPWTAQRFFEQKPSYPGSLPTFSGPQFGRPYPDTMNGIYEAPSPYPFPLIQAKSPGLSSNSSITDLDSDGSVNGTDPNDSRTPSCEWNYPLLSSAEGHGKEGLLGHPNWASQQYVVSPRELQCYPDDAEESSCNDEDSMDFESQQAYFQDTSVSIAVGIADCRDPPEGFSTSVQAEFVGTSRAEDAEDDEADPSCSPVQKGRPSRPRREAQSKRPSPTQANDKPDGVLRKSPKTSKVAKAGKYGSRCDQHPKKTFRNASEYRKHMQTQHTRPFLCTFYFAECDQQFGSKNEWKRHVLSQHLQLGYWQCDYKSCADRSGLNVFNRKDLFTQHLRRMHLDKKLSKENEAKVLPEIWNRCYKSRRQAPTSSTCGYCGKRFEGPGSWEVRMEHVGHHYEDSRNLVNPSDWKEDQELIQWMLRENLIRPKDESPGRGEQQGKPGQWNAPARSAYTVFGLGYRPSRRRSSEDGNSSDAETRSRQRTSAVKAEPATDDDADGDDE